MVSDILMNEITFELAQKIQRALNINKHLTSTYALEVSVDDMYSNSREADPSAAGFYIKLEGTRSGVNFFYNNNLEIARKPSPSKAHVEHTYTRLKGFEESFWYKWADKWVDTTLDEALPQTDLSAKKPTVNEYVKSKWSNYLYSAPVDGPSYITPDGEFINIAEIFDDMGEEFPEDFPCHGALQSIMVQDGVAELPGRFDDGSPALRDAGYIRVNDIEEENNFIELSPDRPRPVQYAALEKWLDRNYRLYPRGYVAVCTPLFMDYVKYDYKVYTTDDILKRIRRYYSSGKLLEKLVEVLQNKELYMKPTSFIVNNAMSRDVDRMFGDRIKNREVLEKNKIKYTIPYDGDLEYFLNRYKIKSLVEKIVKKSDGYYVTSEDGKKNLGGPYDTEDKAKTRLQQVHYFKKKKKNESLNESVSERQKETILRNVEAIDWSYQMTSPENKEITCGLLVLPKAQRWQNGSVTDYPLNVEDENGRGVAFANKEEAQQWFDNHRDRLDVVETRDGIKLVVLEEVNEMLKESAETALDKIKQAGIESDLDPASLKNLAGTRFIGMQSEDIESNVSRLAKAGAFSKAVAEIKFSAAKAKHNKTDLAYIVRYVDGTESVYCGSFFDQAFHLCEKLVEGAEGKRVPGFEYIIFELDDNGEYAPIKAIRSTRVEAEYLCSKLRRDADYDTVYNYEKVPKGKFHVGDDFWGPFDDDYNKIESLKESNNSWNDSWRDNIPEDVYLRLGECRNFYKDLPVMAAAMMKANPDKTADECLSRILTWVCEWNNQWRLYPEEEGEYEALLKDVEIASSRVKESLTEAEGSTDELSYDQKQTIKRKLYEIINRNWLTIFSDEWLRESSIDVTFSNQGTSKKVLQITFDIRKNPYYPVAGYGWDKLDKLKKDLAAFGLKNIKVKTKKVKPRWEDNVYLEVLSISANYDGISVFSESLSTEQQKQARENGSPTEDKKLKEGYDNPSEVKLHVEYFPYSNESLKRKADVVGSNLLGALKTLVTYTNCGINPFNSPEDYTSAEALLKDIQWYNDEPFITVIKNLSTGKILMRDSGGRAGSVEDMGVWTESLNESADGKKSELVEEMDPLYNERELLKSFDWYNRLKRTNHDTTDAAQEIRGICRLLRFSKPEYRSKATNAELIDYIQNNVVQERHGSTRYCDDEIEESLIESVNDEDEFDDDYDWSTAKAPSIGITYTDLVDEMMQYGIDIVNDYDPANAIKEYVKEFYNVSRYTADYIADVIVNNCYNILNMISESLTEGIEVGDRYIDTAKGKRCKVVDTKDVNREKHNSLDSFKDTDVVIEYDNDKSRTYTFKKGEFNVRFRKESLTEGTNGSVEDYLKQMKKTGNPEKVMKNAKGNPNAEKAYKQFKEINDKSLTEDTNDNAGVGLEEVRTVARQIKKRMQQDPDLFNSNRKVTLHTGKSWSDYYFVDIDIFRTVYDEVAFTEETVAKVKKIIEEELEKNQVTLTYTVEQLSERTLRTELFSDTLTPYGKWGRKDPSNESLKESGDNLLFNIGARFKIKGLNNIFKITWKD